MAGHHDRQRVGRARGADGADRLRVGRRDRRPRRSWRCARSRSRAGGSARCGGTRPTAASPAAGRSCAAARRSTRRVPVRAASSRAGASQDPRADPVGQRLQDGVVVFAGVGDPDQAELGRGEQQRADRGCRRCGRRRRGCRRRSAAAASRSCSRRRSSGVPAEGPGQVAGQVIRVHRALLSLRRRPVGAPEGGDAVGGGTAGGVGAAAEDGGDLGVGQPGQVVVGDGLPLLGRQAGERLGEVVVRPESGPSAASAATVSGTSATGTARRAPRG